MESSPTANACPLCGAATPGPAAFCSQCGQPLAGVPRPAPAKPRWYYNVWFVLFMLFFVVGPFGLPLVWKNPRFSRWIKIALTLVMVVYTMALVDVTIRAFQAVMHEMGQLNAVF